MSDYTKELTSKSRTDAKFYRPAIMLRCKGYCEICGKFCPPIIHIHHVKPVSELGPGVPENLIATCPDCHECIHKIRRSMKRGDESALESLHGWIMGAYQEEQAYLLGSVASGTAEYVDLKWIPKSNYLISYT